MRPAPSWPSARTRRRGRRAPRAARGWAGTGRGGARRSCRRGGCRRAASWAGRGGRPGAWAWRPAPPWKGPTERGGREDCRGVGVRWAEVFRTLFGSSRPAATDYDDMKHYSPVPCARLPRPASPSPPPAALAWPGGRGGRHAGTAHPQRALLGGRGQRHVARQPHTIATHITTHYHYPLPRRRHPASPTHRHPPCPVLTECLWGQQRGQVQFQEANRGRQGEVGEELGRGGAGLGLH